MQELSLYLFDTVKNSLAAGASEITIRVRESARRDLLTFLIRDNGRGMSRDILSKAKSPGFTTRGSGRGGMGLFLLEQEAVSCDGGVRVRSSPGTGTILLAYFRLSHESLKPIGDMGETIAALMLDSPGTVLSYSHTVNGRVFAAGTRALEGMRAPVPLGSPGGAVWVKRYINEGLCRIRGL